MNEINGKIKGYNKQNEVVLYMKGNPTFLSVVFPQQLYKF